MNSFTISLIPVDFPPLSECLFPGDQVVLVPDKRIVEEMDIVAEIVAQIVGFGMKPGDLAVVLSESEAKKGEESLRRSLENRLANADPSSVRIVVHDPGNRKEIALLGANAKGEPIGVCRAIVDADFVIPIRSVPERSGRDDYGVFTPVFPRCCDRETQQRFSQAEKGPENPKIREQLLAEVDEAAQLLGIIFVIQRTGNSWTCGPPKNNTSKSRKVPRSRKK